MSTARRPLPLTVAVPIGSTIPASAALSEAVDTVVGTGAATTGVVTC